MTKEQPEYLYGSIEDFYWIALVGSIVFGIIVFILQIYIYGVDDILVKIGCSIVCAVTIFLLGIFEVTLDIIINKE